MLAAGILSTGRTGHGHGTRHGIHRGIPYHHQGRQSLAHHGGHHGHDPYSSQVRWFASV